MVINNVASLGGNGLKDWIMQRVTALYFGAYALFLLGFLVLHPELDYETWKTLFHCIAFKTASVLALFALSLHAWIGIWTVTTDYLKCLVLRMSIQTLVMVGLTAQFFWGFFIIWGQ